MSQRLIKHGMCGTPEYNSWSAMVQRCSNPKHPRYAAWGGRGIRVCDEWKTFDGFFADMGLKPSPKHSIHRVDNDGNYEPGNCIWADAVEQGAALRSNRRITVDGKTLTFAQWERERGFPNGTIRHRVNQYGWDGVRAVLEPLNLIKRGNVSARYAK